MEYGLHDASFMNDKNYVLVIVKPRAVAYGPFHTRDAAEYAAMDYYGTAITGASAKDAFLIVELRADIIPGGAGCIHISHATRRAT